MMAFVNEDAHRKKVPIEIHATSTKIITLYIIITDMERPPPQTETHSKLTDSDKIVRSKQPANDAIVTLRY